MKIGIFFPNWIGDAVMALPFLDQCRKEHEKDKIIAIVRKWVSPIFESNPLIDQLFTIETNEDNSFTGATKVGKRLKNFDFDKIYILTRSMRSAYIAWLSNAKERIGYSGELRSLFLTDPYSQYSLRIHRSRYYLNLINKELFDISERSIYLRKSEISNAKRNLDVLDLKSPIAIFPGSVAASRQLPKSLLHRIVELGLNANNDIILMGGKQEIAIADELVTEFKSKYIKSVCGNLTLRETIALIHLCSGAIGADSGLGHIAANLGLPMLSLFGAGDPEKTAPIGNVTDIVSEKVYCSPCNKNFCHNKMDPLLCLYSMSPEKIWNSYLELLKKVNN
tara:strand:- start:6807 stop:7814 length:1008 start_codon:yes stop_codon:yes gene_type:complete